MEKKTNRVRISLAEFFGTEENMTKALFYNLKASKINNK